MTQRPVLFFADRLPPLIGGMEMHARYFIEYFSGHLQFPLVGIVTKDATGKDCVLVGQKHQVITIQQLSDLFSPAIVFFNSGRWIEDLVRLRNLFVRATFFYRTGGNEILKAELKNKIIPEHELRQAYWAAVLNQTIDLLITNSEFTEIRLRALGINCPLARCVGGVNIAALKRSVAMGKNKVLIIFCAARFVPYKNHNLLLSVFCELIARGYNLKLRLAGEGPLLQEIKNKVQQMKLALFVDFLGSVDNETVGKEITKADIYIQLSSDCETSVPGGSYIHAEGMGRSVLEAISAGTFVIAGKSGALAEIIDGNNGILIELKNSTYVTDMVELVFKHLPPKLPSTDRYSWDNLFKRYEKLMSERVK
jgi:glycosyltransferase involved in cell wall biosynthesis